MIEGSDAIMPYDETLLWGWGTEGSFVRTARRRLSLRFTQSVAPGVFPYHSLRFTQSVAPGVFPYHSLRFTQSVAPGVSSPTVSTSCRLCPRALLSTKRCFGLARSSRHRLDSTAIPPQYAARYETVFRLY